MSITKCQVDDYFVVYSVFIPDSSDGRKEVKRFINQFSSDLSFETIWPMSKPSLWFYSLVGSEILEEETDAINEFAEKSTLRIAMHKTKGVELYVRIQELSEPDNQNCDKCSLGNFHIKFGKDRDLVECFSTDEICRECVSFEIARRLTSSFFKKMKRKSPSLLRIRDFIHEVKCKDGGISNRYRQILAEWAHTLREM